MQKNTKYCSTVKANVANINNTLKRNLGINKRHESGSVACQEMNWLYSFNPFNALQLYYACDNQLWQKTINF